MAKHANLLESAMAAELAEPARFSAGRLLL